MTNVISQKEAEWSWKQTLVVCIHHCVGKRSLYQVTTSGPIVKWWDRHIGWQTKGVYARCQLPPPSSGTWIAIVCFFLLCSNCISEISPLSGTRTHTNTSNHTSALMYFRGYCGWLPNIHSIFYSTKPVMKIPMVLDWSCDQIQSHMLRLMVGIFSGKYYVMIFCLFEKGHWKLFSLLSVNITMPRSEA